MRFVQWPLIPGDKKLLKLLTWKFSPRYPLIMPKFVYVPFPASSMFNFLRHSEKLTVFWLF